MGVVLEPTHDRAPAAAAAPTRFPHCATGVVISPDTSGVHSFHQKRTNYSVRARPCRCVSAESRGARHLKNTHKALVKHQI